MNTFKVSKTLRSSVENVFTRRGILYNLTGEGDNLNIQTDVSGEKFHKMVLRAKMEKLQKEEGSSIPYIAECEQGDFIVMNEVGPAYIIK